MCFYVKTKLRVVLVTTFFIAYSINYAVHIYTYMIGKIRGNKKLRTHMCCLIACVEDFFCSIHLVKLELQKRPALKGSKIRTRTMKL